MSSAPRATDPIQFRETGGYQNASIEPSLTRTTQSKNSVTPSKAGIAGDSDEVSFLRLPEVKAVTGLSKSCLYALIREKNFPAPVRLGPRAVAWVRSEVKKWAAERVHASRSAA
jgi:prophage regulatory protein